MTFIETSKNLELQSAPGFDYKHRNTVKNLLCVVPNSNRKSTLEGPVTKQLCNSVIFLDVLSKHSKI